MFGFIRKLFGNKEDAKAEELFGVVTDSLPRNVRNIIKGQGNVRKTIMNLQKSGDRDRDLLNLVEEVAGDMVTPEQLKQLDLTQIAPLLDVLSDKTARGAETDVDAVIGAVRKILPSVLRSIKPIRNAYEKIRPKDPCPCGSGKIYKRCHRGDIEGLLKILESKEKEKKEK